MAHAKPARPRTKAPEERREEILDAAQRLFLEQGVGQTTIEHITMGADVAKDARSAAVFVFSAVHGVVDDAYSKEKRVNRNRLVQRLERLCFATVGLDDD
jgi:DNA-binding transcriptional regulator YbjK